MATSKSLLLLLLWSQPWLGAGADSDAVVCVETACYTAHWSKLNAAEAQHHCNVNGGNLATVKSEEEAIHVQQALAQLLKSKKPLEQRLGKFWIGLQREKGKCMDHDLPLKGFSWVGGGEDTSYKNWHRDVRTSCISKRCVSLLLDLSLTPHPSQLPKWVDSPCGNPQNSGSSKVEGFVCKFSFKGMCQPLALGGPGQVTYSTPFQAITSSLEAVPFASAANVVCGEETERKSHYFLCKEKAPGVFSWDSSGPLCVGPKFGCNFNNGGCQQDCFEGGDGSYLCGCRPGFRLLDDLVSCASRNPCSSSPCKGGATCVPEPYGQNYTCHCPPGYQLDSSQLGCVDMDECQNSPCAQDCVNTPGGFHCECWVGYKPGGPEEDACRDVDECASDPSPCAQGCINTDGSFHCSCHEGYVLSEEDGTQCKDVDECSDPKGNPCDTECINTPGSFRCGCQQGWELASTGVSCIMPSGSSGSLSEPPPEEDKGARQETTAPPSKTSSSTRAFEGIAKGDPESITTRRPSLSSSFPSTSAPPEMSASSGSPQIWTELGIHFPMTTSHDKPTGENSLVGKDSVAPQSDDGTDGTKLLLFYILGTVVAISLLLALALGLLIYRKRRAKREEIKEKKPQNAADSYSWVPERAENRAMENQYSPTPGTDC
ncbi:complement component C1q receptor [Perognathus longimembris pacificus]|uniref:complement component C1q receptor n=1 Tax=Perognathus longimembris pacificus TaxID=214514 RepID=UPI0020189731|nr:complement component C1q receptor [Perognathus longimembris pacificus]